MKPAWLALFLLGVLLFSVFGIIVSGNNKGLNFRSHFLSSGGHSMDHWHVSAAYVGCYGMDRPIPKVVPGSDLLQVFGVRDQPDCIMFQGEYRKMLLAPDGPYHRINLYTDPAAEGKSMRELDPEQPVFWLIYRSGRRPILASSFHLVDQRSAQESLDEDEQ